MEKKEEKKQDRVKEYKESLQKLQAEFENYKKRVEKENLVFRKHAKAEILKEFLPILDSLELALKNDSNPQGFFKGVQLLHSQFCSLMEKQGLRPIRAEGELFDPYLHEVQMQEESDKDGLVLEEFQKGYLLDDMVLRHSKVKVGNKRGDSNGTKDSRTQTRK